MLQGRGYTATRSSLQTGLILWEQLQIQVSLYSRYGNTAWTNKAAQATFYPLPDGSHQLMCPNASLHRCIYTVYLSPAATAPYHQRSSYPHRTGASSTQQQPSHRHRISSHDSSPRRSSSSHHKPTYSHSSLSSSVKLMAGHYKDHPRGTRSSNSSSVYPRQRRRRERNIGLRASAGRTRS